MKTSGIITLCALLLTASLTARAEDPHHEPVKEPHPVHKTHKPVIKHEAPHRKEKPVPVHHKMQPKPPVKHDMHPDHA
ncbi:hypothetical protein CWS43_09215 [Rahnella sp. AA]|uniref:hypothetical protein n=1 Tax=Rahnella sp. AA TaxID=2057180 RepID=UPI000C33367D|nr:hypothetical protein [Rahnella sp. AA]PKE30853.1 hypothetical protein CWS43_09215 [Rahnella sp. AA]